jgi:hypothetical protein
MMRAMDKITYLIYALCFMLSCISACQAPKDEPTKKIVVLPSMKQVGNTEVSYIGGVGNNYSYVQTFRDDDRKTTCYVLITAGYGEGSAITCLKDESVGVNK